MRVPGSGCASPKDIDGSWTNIQAAALRSLVLSGNARPDGRGFADARQPTSQVNALLPFLLSGCFYPTVDSLAVLFRGFYIKGLDIEPPFFFRGDCVFWLL